MKAITTVVVAYNHREFIARALDSAIAQTGDFSHEILVADDASTDGTADIVRDYAKRHPDLIKDICHLKNLGISANLKRAFGLASGEYIAILEGDDYWTDDRKLEKQMSFLGKNSDCPMVFSRIRLKSGDTFSTLARHDNLPEKIGSGDLLACEWKNPICNFSCCLFRKESVVALPEVDELFMQCQIETKFFAANMKEPCRLAVLAERIPWFKTGFDEPPLISKLYGERAAFAARCSILEHEKAELAARCVRSEEQRRNAEAAKMALERSVCWRMTKPIRCAGQPKGHHHKRVEANLARLRTSCVSLI